MKDLFNRWLNGRTKGDEEKELWWWDVFYRYEVGFGALIAILTSWCVGLVTIPLFFFEDLRKIAGMFFLGPMFTIPAGMLIATLIVSPLYETIGDKSYRKDDVGQGSLLFATMLGYVANLFIYCGPLIALAGSVINFRVAVFIVICITTVIYYILLAIVSVNAKSYVDWRFRWAVENYEKLYSRHYKWWTSAVDMSVQKYNLKKFQKYKLHATLSVIMIPALTAMLILAFLK